MYWFFPEKMLPCISALQLSMFKNLVCHVWWALEYFSLWATNRNNNLYAQCLMVKSSSASLNKCILPQHPLYKNEKVHIFIVLSTKMTERQPNNLRVLFPYQQLNSVAIW